MFIWSVALVSLSGSAVAAEISFNRDIRPILAGHCLKCHGPDLQEGGLRLDRSAPAYAKLESGHHAIVPGEPALSALVDRIEAKDADLRMPPADTGVPLSAAQVERLRQWIAEGAQWETHWAYVPPQRPPLPPIRDTTWVRQPIDRFILERLEKEGIEPAPEASRSQLLRRVTLDLTGLPPTLAELDNFLADPDPDAYEKAVDRLLASPQYGVRQSIPWLDLARYADTDGYPHDDNRIIWPYRDWVVDALNQDMPFDQFTIEQLAGDLLPSPTDSQRIATGFHRNTRINIEAGSDPETYRMEAVFDRVGTTGTVWLGSTIACAQCHNHKYDPFTQEDYYRLVALFNSGAVETTTDEAGVVKNVSPKWPYLNQAQLLAKQELEAEYLVAANDEERKRIEQELEAIKPAKSLVMQEHTEPRPTYVLRRGDLTQPDRKVEPGIPAFLNPRDLPVRDRLELARWLVAKDNPLTARVHVNRLWMQLFGTPLVSTTEDFGLQGSLASHEALLDWLANELIAGGWRQKPLLRMLVTSATYRQSAAASQSSLEKDPTNQLFSRAPRTRLSAEIVRDQALAIGGLLDLSLGGPSVMASSMGAGGNLSSPFRRSIYVYWKRQQLDESFENLDAPSRDVTCTRRIRTNTPLQALSLLNDRVYMDAARGLAGRIVTSGKKSVADRMELAARICWSRPPSEKEREILTELFQQRKEAFSHSPESAKQVVTQGTVPPPAEADIVELAAWTMVANTLLNVDETYTRE